MRRLVWPALLIGVTLAIYAPAVGYGLIWDDPHWYGQAAGKSLAQLFFGLGSYQFYRPLSLLLNQFITADGRILAGAAHAVQIAAHLAAVLLVAPAARALGLRRWHADLSALGFALYPAAFQTVAWEAPQGPWVMALILGALAAAGRFAQQPRLAWSVLAVASYAAALLFQESAVPLSAFVVWAAWQPLWRATEAQPWRRRLWSMVRGLRSRRGLFAFAIVVVVAAYLAIWINVPRDANVTGEGRDPRVLAYFLQAAAWPVARALAVPLASWQPLSLAVGFGLVVLVLALGLGLRGEGLAALIGLGWVTATLLPHYVGLSWEYVSYGERLTYVMGPGVAVLWAGLAVWLIPWGRARRVTWAIWAARSLLPVGATLGLAAYAGLALAQLRDFRALYGTGTGHLRAAVEALAAAPDEASLFVNFPDRYELRAPYYPLGFWGIVLAPVVQDLRDFALADAGQSGADRSLSAFVTGTADREAWRYRVDMRGVNAGPEALFAECRAADHVWLTDYLPGGGLRLSDVGDVVSDPGGSALATFGDLLALRAATLTADGALELRWAALRQPGLDDALFIHVWRDGAFVTDVGGDALGGLLPLWSFQPGALVIDRRRIDLPGPFEIRVGVYNRLTGERYSLQDAPGVDGGFIIP